MAFIEASKPWPNAQVYYEISNEFSSGDVSNIIQAMNNWQDYAGYKFTARNGEANYIQFSLISSGNNNSDSVGMATGKQCIHLKANREVVKIMHEIGHAVGLYHEQQRIDTESFLNIDWDNISSGMNNYTSVPSGTLIGNYGYYSIMQYKEQSTNFAVNSNQNILTPYDDNINTLGQRILPSSGDVNGVQAMYANTRIETISTTIKTGSNSTNAKVYLGIGGREFCLAHISFGFDSNSTVNVVLGAGSNVQNASQNDPKNPSIQLRDVLRLPVYLRLEDNADWDVEKVVVTLQGISAPAFPDISFGFLPGAVRFDTTATQLIRLTRLSLNGLPFASQDSNYPRNIKSITVSTNTGNDATDNSVYLGIAGREFRMDTSSDDFEDNNSDTFTFGHNSNVSNSSDNDPRNPALTIDDLNSNVVYIRKDGTDDWDLSSASIVVKYQDNSGNNVGSEVNFDLIAGGFKLTDDGSRYAYFKYSDRTVQQTVNVSKITATINTGGTGTNDRIYLGIGGREFRLDTSNDDFTTNSQFSFILGAGANVENASLNNPTSPQLTELDILTNHIYIRKEDTGNWTMASASVSIDFSSGTSSSYTSYLSNLELGPDYGEKVYLSK